MLKSLSVTNYALIDDLHLHFGKSLNIITGETGAGKSILLGALGLLLGQRADTTALLDLSKKCIIEGEFNSDILAIEQFFIDNELDKEEKIILRREITKEGKSRAFINDTPVNLSQLKELGGYLVDIHSQHETLLLNKAGFQLEVVDAFAGHEKEIKTYKKLFSEYKVLTTALQELKVREEKAKSEQDYLHYQLNELNEVNPAKGEQEKFEAELESLNHSEEIVSGLHRLSTTLSGNEINVLTNLASLQQIAIGLSKYHLGLNSITERIKSLYIECKDVDSEIEKLSEEIIPNPDRQEVVQDRLDILYKLQQKHRVKSIEELLDFKVQVELKLTSILSMEEAINTTTKKLDEIKKALISKADNISSNRLKVIPGIESKIKKLLSEVSMPNAVLKIESTLLNDEELNQNGRDSIRFQFSANKGIPYAEISKVASGGELSRLMLCLKSMVAKLIDLPTVIFDEIDTGVSGETAFKIGKLMQDFSKARQLIAISHLPQIASRGEDHFFVYKEVVSKKTFTRVKKLSNDERVVEVARMLSGDKPTAVAIENAKELLSI